MRDLTIIDVRLVVVYECLQLRHRVRHTCGLVISRFSKPGNTALFVPNPLRVTDAVPLQLSEHFYLPKHSPYHG
jgi:hypothetical protein